MGANGSTNSSLLDEQFGKKGSLDGPSTSLDMTGQGSGRFEKLKIEGAKSGLATPTPRK